MEREKITNLIKREAVFEKPKGEDQKGINCWWNFSSSLSLDQKQKQSITHTLKKNISRSGVLVVSYSKHPTILKNKRECLIGMTRLVSHALKSGKVEFKQNKSKQQKDILIRQGRVGR